MKQFFSVLFMLVFLGGMSFAQNSPVIDKGSDFTVNPKPHNNPPQELVPIEETFGSNANVYAGGPQRARGNFFTCTTSRRVVEHRLYLNPTVATTMYFCIYEGDVQAGTYNQISAVEVTGQGPGEGWYSSGPIDVTLTAGKFYVIYTQMDAQTAYYNQQAISPFPVPCSFGEQSGGAGYATGSVPIYGNPPPATQTFTAAAFVDPVAYYQTIVTDDVGGGAEFFDDFDSYIAGQTLCTQTTEWQTWSGTPGTTEDPMVSSVYSYSPSNTMLIVQNNDCVRMHGPKTSGKWYMSFVFYIPSGNSGYFNTMNGFAPNPNVWGMDCYFNVGGVGNVDTTGGGSSTNGAAFNWVQDAWNQAVVVVDLDNSVAEFWIGTNPSNFTQVATWDWTQGGTKVNELAVNDFYGAAATDQMYVDDYYFGDAMPPIIPVELTSFTAISINGSVELNWKTATEVNNQGFEIERRTETSEFNSIGFVQGSGTTTEQRSYSYLDQSAEQGINYYRLKQIDFDGTFSYSDEVEVNVTAPLSFDLGQNYPNPFNPSTNIKYSVPEAGNVKIAVYNLVGEEVAILVDGFTQAGTFEVTFDASNLSSGVYLYKLQSANSVMTKKMMLLK